VKLFNLTLEKVVQWPRLLGIAIKEGHMEFTNPLNVESGV